MSPAPGVTYTIRDTPPTRSIPQGTSRAFVAGMTERGPLTPVKVTSITEFVATFGGYVSYGFLYDALDVAFRDGLSEAWVSRVVGPAPVIASSPLFDASGSVDPGDISLVVTAKSSGAWANTVTPSVVAGEASGFRIRLTDSVDGILETSPDLADRAEAVSWGASSDYATVSLGASAENPRVQAGTAWDLGDGDEDSATDTEWAAALARFAADLGGGQVAAPGRTSGTGHNQLLEHARTMNRTAILDAADTATVATLTAAAAAARGHAGARFGGMFGPWAVVPGRDGLAGTTRTVPYSAVQLGLIARSDEAGNPPNAAAAGDNGISLYAIGLSQESWTDAERATLNDAGFNVARYQYGLVRTYGYRTLANPLTLPAWVGLGGSREVSYILSKVQEIAETFEFDQIDGRKRTIGRWGGAIGVVCSTEYERDALYGATPMEAYTVDTGPAVNTEATIADGKLRVALALKTSPMAERVEIEVVKVLTTESLG